MRDELIMVQESEYSQNGMKPIQSMLKKERKTKIEIKLEKDE